MGIRFSRGVAGALMLLVAGATCTGCSLFVPKHRYDRVGTAGESVAKKNVAAGDSLVLAVGGFVAGPQAHWDQFVGVPESELPEFGVLAQSRFWAHHVTTALRTRAARGDEVIGWSTLVDAVPTKTLTDILVVFASGGEVRANRIRDLHQDLPRARYLVLGRLDYNFAEYRGASSAGMRGSLGRSIDVTLECYDLRDGQAVWRRSRQAFRTGGVGVEVREEDSHAILMPRNNGNRDVGITGTTVDTPDLDEMITAVVGKLASQLLWDLGRPDSAEPGLGGVP